MKRIPPQLQGKVLLLDVEKQEWAWGSAPRSARLVVTSPLTVYKKVRHLDSTPIPLTDHYRPRGPVIELMIPPDAVVIIHEDTSKCRTNVALTGEQQGLTFCSIYESSFKYHPNSIITTRDGVLSKHRRTWAIDCATGIHFFFNKNAAHRY